MSFAAGPALFGGISLMGSAVCRPANPGFVPSPFKINYFNEDNFSFEEDHFPRHDIECKSKKDAKDKAQEYGGGEPPEGPHHDGYGSHYHPMRRRNNRRQKIPNVHFKFISKNPFIYKIQNGDCLSKIAEKFGVSVQELQKWNKINNPNLIYAGNTLKIYR